MVGGYRRGRVGSWECVDVEMIAGVGGYRGGQLWWRGSRWLQTVSNHGGEGASRLPTVGNCGGEGVGVVCMAVGQKECGELYGVVVIK